MDAMITPYADVNEFLQTYCELVQKTLEANLVGIYLTGSLTYDAFNYAGSDIDVTNILRQRADRNELKQIRAVHDEMEAHFPFWSQRFECTYTPLHLLPSILPPEEPRPWYWGGEGRLYAEARYGNEWIINAHFLYQCSQPLFGPAYRTLSPPIDPVEVQKACVRDLFTEWVPKKSEPAWFEDSHQCAYFVVNLCRIITTVCTGEAGSKPASVRWAKENLDPQWRSLIDAAAGWTYGDDFDRPREAMAFLDHIVDRVTATDIDFL